LLLRPLRCPNRPRVASLDIQRPRTKLVEMGAATALESEISFTKQDITE
jgi:hypothetical protein